MANLVSLRTQLSDPKRWLSRLKSVFNASSTTKSVQMGDPHSQQQSFLLNRLPIEVREIIYYHVFGPSLIHTVEMGWRLAHVRCLEWQVGEVWDGHRHGIEGLEGRPILDKLKDPNDQLLALCLTCRLMCVPWISPLMLVNTPSQHSTSNLQRIDPPPQLHRSSSSHVFNANIYNSSIPHSSRQSHVLVAPLSSQFASRN